jgi:two-component system, chemotaxis family, sensor kinase CheA
MSHFGHLNDSEFEDLKNVFYSEAYEIVENLGDLLLALEASPEDEAALKAIKRHVHTLKGDANSIGLASVGGLCHSMEDVLLSLIGGSSDLKRDCADLLIGGVDTISRLLMESESGMAETKEDSMVARIDAFMQKNSNHPSQRSSGSPAQGSELTEYQYLDLEDARTKGLAIYEMEMVFHVMCQDKGPAAFMVIQRLNDRGRVIRSTPDVESSDIERAERMTILIGTHLGAEQLRKEAFIPGITAEIQVKDFSASRLAGRSPHGNHLNERPEQPNPPNCEFKPSYARNEILRVEAPKVDSLMELAGELIIGRSMIDQLARDLEDGASKEEIIGRLFAANSYMERTVADLQKGIMKMRMVPVNRVFRKFPKIVRDLCSENGKKVRLDIQGKETELDKGVVDALGEPLSHIIRNMIDHGIEEPACRISIGKHEEGSITLRAYHEAAQIVIEASDDGGGIGIEKLRKKALEKGLLSEDDAEKLSGDDAVNLIFLSGLSTSEIVSETSGRGIGMDAVKSAVDAMKGSIEVDSTPGGGTTFRLRLPLTLAVIKALLFEVGGGLYAIPVSMVTDVARIVTDDLVTVDGKDTFMLRDRIISVIRLQGLFDVPEGKEKRKFILILGVGSKRIGVLVDRLKGEQELVIKAVDEWYVKSGLVTGASVLGSGRVVLILDAPAIFRKAVDDAKKRTVAA